MATTTTTRWPGVRRVSLAIAAATALLLGACSPQEGATTPQPGDGQPAEVKRALSIATVQPPNSMDPAQLSDGQQAFVWNSVFETLLYRENGTGELKPGAAESWEFSPDGTQLTFHMRDGLTFSTGAPVTAADVAATMERTRTTPGLQQGKFAHVSGVTATDDKTVVVAFKEFDPAFLPSMTQAAGVIGDAASLAEERTATDPVGSGPYVLDVAASVPGTTYVLNRREDYWDKGSFPYATLTVRVLQDPAATLNAFQAGEINATSVRPQQFSAVEGVEGVQFTEVDAQAAIFLNFLDRGGEEFKELGDVRVRRAINYAIDSAGILAGINQGAGLVTQQIFGPHSPVFEESLNQNYTYDPDKARQLLAEAGYADGFTLKIPSTYVTGSMEPTLSQELGEVGIKLDWVPVPPQQAQAATQSGEFGVALQVVGLAPYQLQAKDYFGQGGFNNPRNYQDDVTSELWQKIDTTVDADEALTYYRQLNERVVEEAFLAPIVFSGATWATRDQVTYLDNGASGTQTVRTFGVAGQ